MRPAGTPFAFAGVYDVGRDRNGQALTVRHRHFEQ
jgi:hypothetical protein